MPIYLYRCPVCNKEREIAHAMLDDSVYACPFCGHAPMAKIPASMPMVSWNGRKPSDGGVTDYVNQLTANAPRRRDELTEQRGGQ